MEDQYTEQLKMAPLFEPLKIVEEKQVCNAFCCMNATLKYISNQIHIQSLSVSVPKYFQPPPSDRRVWLCIPTYGVQYIPPSQTHHTSFLVPPFYSMPFFLYFLSSSTSLCACYTPIASKQHQIRLVRKGFFEFNLTSFNISYSNC